MEGEYEKIPNYDMKTVLGDANAQIGKEGKHVKINDNGKMQIDFARRKNLIIKSTYFPRKETHKGTWRAPNQRYTNQIGHVLIKKKE